ncbi:MAG: sulfite exporter TauE/SafE family protein [Gemmatimonadales bacterium]
MLGLVVSLGLLIGLSLGLLGGGGSILTVPLLVYALGFEAKASIAMSLWVAGVTSSIGTIVHWRIGNVHVRVALVFGSVAMVGTYLGARLSVLVSGTFQLVLFAVVMMAAGYFMLLGRVPGVRAGKADLHLADRSKLPIALIVTEGLAVGVLTGLVGVGGGFLIVPALVLLVRIPMKQAVGTSLAVISMKSATGFLGYLGQVEIDWSFIGLFTTVAIVGIVIGTWIVRFAQQRALRRAFAILLLIMGAAILYQNRGAFVPAQEVGAGSEVSTEGGR